MSRTAPTPRSFDAVIIGAGVIGSATAVELSRKGLKVAVVDSLAAAGAGSTSYSSGICRMCYSIMESVQFSYEGFHYWRDWEEYIGVPDERGYAKLTETPSLLVRTAATSRFLDTTVPLMRAVGIECQEWGPEKLRAIGWDTSLFGPPKRIDHETFGVGDGEILGAVYTPVSGYVSDPQLAVHNLQMAAEAAGATFLFNNEVTQVIKDKGRVTGVGFRDGSHIAAGVTINAAGPFSSTVTQLAFADTDVANDMLITTRPNRQEVAYIPLELGSDAFNTHKFITFDADTGCYFRPDAGNMLLVGSVEPECDELELLNHPDEMNPSISDNWTNYVYRCAVRVPSTPIPAGNNTRGIVAMYDVTEDWTPIYDKSALDGYYMAIGTSGNQFKNAAAAGVLMSQIVLESENGRDQDTDPLQLELTKSGTGTLNTARFSRLRKVLETTASVLG